MRDISGGFLTEPKIDYLFQMLLMCNEHAAHASRNKPSALAFVNPQRRSLQSRSRLTYLCPSGVSSPDRSRVRGGTPAPVACCSCRRGSVVSIVLTGDDVVGRCARSRTRLSPARVVARRLGLHYVQQDELTLRRRRRGSGFSYLREDGSVIRDSATVRRLASLAVPPAYDDVRYAADAAAHLQAIGRDAAGRLQYRYHPAWQMVRETRKARRLVRLAEALPKIRRSVAQHLSNTEPSRELAFAAVIELIARSAIRPGNDSYTKRHRTHGATTLLKSHVSVEGSTITLTFRSKGNKLVQKEVDGSRLIDAIAVLQQLPGRRLFQYRDEVGTVQPVRSAQVNRFLREIARAKISLKDFRTLSASGSVLEALAATFRATSARQRRSQILDAVRSTAKKLANTPTICRKSYVHEAIVVAFEEGALERFAAALQGCRSQATREQILARVIATVDVPERPQSGNARFAAKGNLSC
jgi:DNA topoisomerase-1